MRSFDSEVGIPTTEIDGHPCRAATILSRERKFSKICKVLWLKPVPTIASIAKCDIRTAQRMLAGKAEVPWCLLRAMLDEMLKPD